MIAKERFLLKAVGDTPKALTVGIIKFIELCQKYGDGVICLPNMQAADSPILAEAIGGELAKTLAKKGSIFLPTGQKVDLCSHNTFKKFNVAAVYLLLWASKDTIAKLEQETYFYKGSIVITWNEDDADQWIENYHPTQLKW